MKKLVLPFAAIIILSFMAPALQLVVFPEMALVQNADAQIQPGGRDIPTTFTTEGSVYSAINRVAKFLFNIFLGLAVIFLIVAALFYLTAAGNQAQLDRSKNVLIYSIVAIVIALVAGGVTSFVEDILK